MKNQTNLPTKQIAGMGILAAMSLALVYLIHFPIFPAAPFLQYDPADIPILLCTFMFGPLAGLGLTAFVCIIQSVAISGDFPYGFIMHFLATGSLVLVAGLFYKRKRTLKSAVIGMAFGIVTWVVVMIFANLVITPLYMGATPEIADAIRAQVISLLLPAIIPFNLIKPLINCLITLLIYKRVHHIFNRMFKIPEFEAPNAYPTDCSGKFDFIGTKSDNSDNEVAK
jgi:riboflavin transporter FmnP